MILQIKNKILFENTFGDVLNYHTAGWHLIRRLHLQSEKPNLKINKAPSGVHCNESLCSTLQLDFML